MKDKTKDRATGNTFFCVVKDAETTTVSYRHATINGAYTEACRLARKENKSFYIMQTVAKVVPKVVINDVLDVRPPQREEPEPEDPDADEQACREFVASFEKTLSQIGFKHDPFTNTWKKEF